MMLSTLALAAALAAPAASSDLRATLQGTRVESLAVALRRLEASRSRPEQGGDAALLLGQLHYARGEYRDAADAFARAAARLDPTRKPEARYWGGLCWIALGDASQARSALEGVVQSSSARRPLAMLALAQAWDLAGKPDRSFDVLRRLLEEDPGEAGPAALARFAALADGFERPDEARRARARLMREYPASIEAAAARLAAPGRRSP